MIRWLSFKTRIDSKCIASTQKPKYFMVSFPQIPQQDGHGKLTIVTNKKAEP